MAFAILSVPEDAFPSETKDIDIPWANRISRTFERVDLPKLQKMAFLNIVLPLFV